MRAVFPHDLIAYLLNDEDICK